MVAVDPLASLGIRDSYVTIGGKEYLLEGRPAADWLTEIVSGDLSSIIPGWLSEEDEAQVLDALADDLISVKEIADVTLDAITIAAGRPWWWAMSLIQYATSDIHHWSRVNGRLMLAAVDASQISLSAWVDAVYAAHIEKMDDPEKYTEFKSQMDLPPTPDLLDEEEESEAFLSMMG